MLPDGYDLICILGPTASGKTRYAVQMARECDGEILSKAKSREGTHEKYANTPESATIVFGDLADEVFLCITGCGHAKT